ncbi:MAG: transposase [Coriobacteriales bacterium]|nr:transposase [Coriobacteriales bacterium]
MRLSSGHVDEIARMMAEADAELDRLMAPHSDAVAIVASVPGFTERSAKVLLAEIGCDMSQFADARHLCSWAGLSPRSNSSAGKSRSSHVMRAGTYLKPLLVQCALTASTRCKGEDYFAGKYQRIKARRGHKRAIIAVARMMLACIYRMLSNGELFDPTDRAGGGGSADRREPGVDDAARAIELLASLGYDVSSLRAPD